MTVLLDRETELFGLARRSIDEGRTFAGRALVNAVRFGLPQDLGSLGADAADRDGAGEGPFADRLEEMDARLMLDEGRLDAAGDLASRAVARSPANWRLRCLRADIRLTARDAVGAAQDAADAVVMAPREAAPKAALGSALLLLGHAGDAAACLAEAVAGNPGHVGYRLTLARALADLGEPHAARATLEEAIGLRPRAAALRIAAIRIALNQHDLSHALALADDAREQGVIDACILGLRGHILSCLGDEPAAVLAYQEALQLAPEDSYVRHLVAAAGLVAPPRRASPDYVRVVFNGFAGHFERDLVRLDYRIPGLIRAALLKHMPQIGLLGEVSPDHAAGPAAMPAPLLGPVLDLGCGTGLVAVVLSDLAIGPFTGIDLSSAMLAEAAAKHLYGRLIEGDIYADMTMLGPFRLAIAADVLPYLGDPTPVLTSVAALLIPGSLFILTIEALDESDASAFRLGTRARYEHRASALTRAAQVAGFTVLECRSATLRRDRDRPVGGCVIVLERKVLEAAP